MTRNASYRLCIDIFYESKSKVCATPDLKSAVASAASPHVFRRPCLHLHSGNLADSFIKSDFSQCIQLDKVDKQPQVKRGFVVVGLVICWLVRSFLP